MKTQFKTKNIFDGGTCVTPANNPNHVVMLHEGELVYRQFVPGNGWQTVRKLTEEEKSDLKTHEKK